MPIPRSPVTGSTNVTREETLDVPRVINCYARDFGLDVSRYFARGEPLEIWRCDDTGYRFYHPFKVAGDESLYSHLQKRTRSDYYPVWKWEYEIASRALAETAAAEILDVGCGDGAFLEARKSSGCGVTGLEFSAAAREVCAKRGLRVLDESLQAHAEKHQEFYDAVCSFQVLEHVAEVRSFLEAAVACVRPGGLIVLGVPHNCPYLFGRDRYHTLNLPPHHMGLWNDLSLRRTAAVFGTGLPPDRDRTAALVCGMARGSNARTPKGSAFGALDHASPFCHGAQSSPAYQPSSGTHGRRDPASRSCRSVAHLSPVNDHSSGDPPPSNVPEREGQFRVPLPEEFRERFGIARHLELLGLHPPS